MTRLSSTETGEAEANRITAVAIKNDSEISILKIGE